MVYLNKKFSIFILGPDSKRLVRDALKDKDFLYFSPDEELIWNFTVIFFVAIYFLKLYNLKSGVVSALKSAYLTAIVRALAKKTVITPIDNNIHFYNAARLLHSNLNFIAIQNGTKFYSNKYFYPDVRDIFIPQLICFGNYDQDSLTSLGASIEYFHPIGSAFEKKSREYSSTYQNFILGQRDIKYDICLISEDFTNWGFTQV